MLEDELRATKAELESAVASHRAELVERETEFEGGVRSAREEFQAQIASLETRHEDDLATRDRRMATRLEAAEAAAEAKVERVRQELSDRDARYGVAEQVVAEAKEEAGRLGEELANTRLELDETVARLLSETNIVRELNEKTGFVQREATDASTRAERLAEELDDATQSNADLNRRLQELESRRALEIANVEGRADLDQLLRVTQERLAGQTERLIAAEDNAHRLERELRRSSSRSTRSRASFATCRWPKPCARSAARGTRPPRRRPRPRARRSPPHRRAWMRTGCRSRTGADLTLHEGALPRRPEVAHADPGPHADPQAQEGREGAGAAGAATHHVRAPARPRGVRHGRRRQARARHRRAHGPPHGSRGARAPRGRGVRRGVGPRGAHRRGARRRGAGSAPDRTDPGRVAQVRRGPDTAEADHHRASAEPPRRGAAVGRGSRAVLRRLPQPGGAALRRDAGRLGEGGERHRGRVGVPVFLPDGAGTSDSEDAPIVVATEETEEEEPWTPDGAQLLVQELHRLSEIAAED